MALALVSTEFLAAMAMVALLIGVPLFVICVIAVVSGYIQHDAERYLDDLETDADEVRAENERR